MNEMIFKKTSESYPFANNAVKTQRSSYIQALLMLYNQACFIYN